IIQEWSHFCSLLKIKNSFYKNIIYLLTKLSFIPLSLQNFQVFLLLLDVLASLLLLGVLAFYHYLDLDLSFHLDHILEWSFQFLEFHFPWLWYMSHLFLFRKC